MPHVPDAVVVRLDVDQAVHAPGGQAQGEQDDGDHGGCPDHEGGHPVPEDVGPGPGAGPGRGLPAGPSSLLPRLPPLVQQQTGNKEGRGEHKEEDDTEAAEVAEPSQNRHALQCQT